MTKPNENPRRITKVFGCAVLVFFAFSIPCRAEIKLDGSMGPSGALTGPNFAIDASLGRQVASNLFHSFEVFNVKSGETATFTGPDSVANILGRVTGDKQSTIDGTLSTKFRNATPNLFLLNRAGVMFGPNAKIDVQGSFHVSTADYVRLEDGSQFSALPSPTDATLTTSPPETFGFLAQQKQAEITVSGSHLRVAKGRTLSLIGMPTERSGIAQQKVKVSNGILDAPAGYIAIEQIAPNTEHRIMASVSRPDSNTIESIHLPENFEKQDVFIRGGTFIVSGGARVGQHGGDITVVVDKLELKDQGTLSSGGEPIGFVDAGSINLTASDSVTISNSGLNFFNLFAGTFTGDAGDIRISTPEMIVTNGSISSQPIFAGTGGEIVLTLGTLKLLDGAQILTTSFGDQQAGDIKVNANHSILISGRKGNPSNINAVVNGPGDAGDISISTPRLAIAEGLISATIEGDGGGDAGKIDLHVGNLTIDQGGSVLSDTAGSGRGGIINVRHADAVKMNDGGSMRAVSGSTGLDLSENPDAGKSGSISIYTNTLNMERGSRITVETIQANAGDINVEAKRLVHLRDKSTISTSAAVVGDEGTGQGGDITIDPNIVALAGGSEILAKAKKGQGGNIKISITEGGALFKSPDSKIDASAGPAGIDGTVEISRTDSDIIEGTLVLPESYLDVTTLLSEPCRASSAENESSFVVRGRSGLPPGPDSVLFGNFTDDYGVSDTTTSDKPTIISALTRGASVLIDVERNPCIK